MKNNNGSFYSKVNTYNLLINSLAVGAVISLFAWFTHIFHCLNEQLWGFLIAGAIAFPIAIVHGIGLWFGFF